MKPIITITSSTSNVNYSKAFKWKEETTGNESPHWEYNNKTSRPYNFSHHVCENSYLNPKDCTQTSQHCNDDLMNWIYLDETNTPLPKFSIDGFRHKMRNKRLVFIGSSLMRQQVLALSWTLGHTHINWSKIHTKELEEQIEIPCTAPRSCFIDVQDNITICFQFMGTMTTNIYLEENYTLNLSLRGHGDSSCLLHDDMIANLAKFDMVFFRPPIVWWSGTRNALSSDSSPKEWLQKIIPIVYYDALNDFLTKISKRTKPILVLGQIGTACQNKTQPEAWSAKDIPDSYGWQLAPTLWNETLLLIEERKLNVQIVDAREPLMQSVHAHPSTAPDCLHFCMNSAAVNIYLDKYWNEVFLGYL